MYRVRLSKHKEILDEQRKREAKGFTFEEVRLLIQAMKDKAQTEDDTRKRLMIEFHYYAGDRISETCGVKYRDIEVRKGILKLDSQYDSSSSLKRPALTTLKNRQSERVIRLNGRMIEILNWFEVHNTTKSEFVFVSEIGSIL